MQQIKDFIIDSRFLVGFTAGAGVVLALFLAVL